MKIGLIFKHPISGEGYTEVSVAEMDATINAYIKAGYDYIGNRPAQYHPEPLNTSHVQLSDDLLSLTESLAKNTHDIWALGRISQGWVYGKERDDEMKTHPCLVEYDELSDAEKQYDRNTALETLKMIVALGYEIKKVGDLEL
jgi:hypothetical protein